MVMRYNGEIGALPEGTVKASITTEVQDERLDADETLLTVQVARFAISVPEGLGTANAVLASAARTSGVRARGCMTGVTEEDWEDSRE